MSRLFLAKFDITPISLSLLVTRHQAALMLAVLFSCLAVLSAPAQSPRLVGSVHGIVVADVPSPGGTTSILLPGVKLTIVDAIDGSARAQAVTALSGAFATPLLPAGNYWVCATAVGFAENCSEPVQITTHTVSLRQLLALTPQAGVLHGHVKLSDGNPAVRVAVAQGTSAGTSQISLTQGTRAVAGPATVNAFGDYVLAPITASADLVLTAFYEAESASRTIALSKPDLDGGAPVDIILSSSAPKVVAITATQNGIPITSATPGSTIILTVLAQDAGPGTLHYRWSSSSPGLDAGDRSSVTMTLSNAPVATDVFVEITNSRGGVTRGLVTIPLVASSAQQPRLQIQSIGTPTIPGGGTPTIPGDHSSPAHSGLFIDPTARMLGACTDEQSCEAEAELYYKAIGALNSDSQPKSTPPGTFTHPAATGTFKGWKSAYGFSADPTQPASGEIRAVYYNNGDLQFGRDMHCRMNSTSSAVIVACYVSNYDDGIRPYGSDPQKAISRAAFNILRAGTVAMVSQFSRQSALVQPPQNFAVQFYFFNEIFENDQNDGELRS
jgi:hypothetical protein